MAEAVSEALAAIGIPREDKSYSPHLTLARAGSRGNLKALTSSVEGEAFGRMTAQEFFLYRSQLGRGGSKYTKLERFGLSER